MNNAISFDWNLFWTAFGAIGGTVGALATAAAVIVALWQTKYNFKKKIRVKFTDSSIAVNDVSKRKLICVEIINIGNRDVNIQSWGFKVNKKKQFLLYTYLADDPFLKSLNPKFPHAIKIEESQSLYYPLALFKEQMADFLKSKEIHPSKKIEFFIKDSTGKEYAVKTPKSVKWYALVDTEIKE